MKKSRIKYYVILISIFVVLIFVEYSAPKDLNWKATFSKNDKIPFGNYVLYELLQNIFPKNQFFENRTSFAKDSIQKSNYIFITREFSTDSAESEKMLNMVSEGATFFIAADWFSGKIADTLQIRTDIRFFSDITDTVFINFYNKNLHSQKKYGYTKVGFENYFVRFDSLNTTLLGSSDFDEINFIKINFGKGAFFLHSQPYFFTNYNLLHKNNSEYAAKCFSYLPYEKTFWDEYYKPYRILEEEETPLRYILTQPALKISYFLLIFGILIYIFFEGKRRQRIIPIFESPRNTSLDFVEIIGRLYFQTGNHKDIAQKKWNYLCEFLRTKYFLSVSLENWNENISLILEKTGVSLEIIKNLHNSFRFISQKSNIDKENLMSFNIFIEKFYNECL